MDAARSGGRRHRSRRGGRLRAALRALDDLVQVHAGVITIVGTAVVIGLCVVILVLDRMLVRY